jgi:hypothetical protein
MEVNCQTGKISTQVYNEGLGVVVVTCVASSQLKGPSGGLCWCDVLAGAAQFSLHKQMEGTG